MALKTQRNRKSVSAFLNGVPGEQRRTDCLTVMKIMESVTRSKAEMWGDSLVGFGSYYYKYASGQEGDWPLVAFSPRKQNLTLYIMPGFAGYGDLMARLGKFKTGRSCLYLKSLDDVDLPTLKELVRQSVRHMKQTVKERGKAT